MLPACPAQTKKMEKGKTGKLLECELTSWGPKRGPSMMRLQIQEGQAQDDEDFKPLDPRKQVLGRLGAHPQGWQ